MSERQTNPVIAMIDEVIRLNSRLRSVFAGSREESGLGKIEASVLSAVVDSQAAPTVPQIGRSLGHPRQVIQRAANALIAADLVRAVENPDHKRASLLHPTPAGEALKRETDARAIASADALLQVIDADRCRGLNKELSEMRAAIEDYLRRRDS